MKVLTLTREYPPHVYGGAGVHVDHLTRELAKIMDVDVRCFGDQYDVPSSGGAPSVRQFGSWKEMLAEADPILARVLGPLSVDVAMAALPTDADIVHCHTWYSMIGGLWAKLLYEIPLVVTTHSLEPLRPWKEEQLRSGYRLSSWIERTAVQTADAVIAVSDRTRSEVLECYDLDPTRVKVIYNGIDLDVYQPKDPASVLERYEIPRDKPFLFFVGRVTRQKGVFHLLRALRNVTPELNAVLCAGAPDTPRIASEMEQAVTDLQHHRPGVFWLREQIAVPDLVALYSGAVLFVCPSIYEPFGIINLEAMATGCPVVATRVGGIPEVVVDGETGVLVPFERRDAPDFEALEPERLARDLAAAINRLFADEATRERMGKAGRKRVEEMFSWKRIAAQTRDLYAEVIEERGRGVEGSRGRGKN